MATKEELSDKLSSIFEIDLDFSKMTKDDLEKLVEQVSDPRLLIKLGLSHMKEKAKQEIMNRPIREIIESLSMPKEGEKSVKRWRPGSILERVLARQS